MDVARDCIISHVLERWTLATSVWWSVRRTLYHGSRKTAETKATLSNSIGLGRWRQLNNVLANRHSTFSVSSSHFSHTPQKSPAVNWSHCRHFVAILAGFRASTKTAIFCHSALR